MSGHFEKGAWVEDNNIVPEELHPHDYIIKEIANNQYQLAKDLREIRDTCDRQTTESWLQYILRRFRF